MSVKQQSHCAYYLPTPYSLLPTRSLRFFIARQDVVRSLPRREIVEIAKLLDQLHRFVHHPFLFIVIAHLNMAGEREVLAQRITFEAVVGQDAAQIRVTG